MTLQFSFKSSAPKETLEERYDFVSLGGGPASLNAALYAKRKGLKTLLIGKKMGGQLLNTDSVENYLGLHEKSGEELAEAFQAHLKALKVTQLSDTWVTHVSKSNQDFILDLEDGRQIITQTLMVATGSNPRKLEVKGEDTFANAGVAYCAICDAPLFKDKKVLIAGGGNSAVEAVIDVAKFASEVTLVHRSELRADQILIDRMKSLPNVSVILQTQIQEVYGQHKMEGIRVLDKTTQSTYELKADGLFIEIGHLPKNELFKDWVKLNEKGEIIVDEYQATNIPGLFAAGDVTHTPYKQIIIAVADGAKAALAANDYIHKN